MPCPTCGAETHAGQRFCMDCGALLDAGAAAPTTVVPAVDGPAAAPSAAAPSAVAPTTVLPVHDATAPPPRVVPAPDPVVVPVAPVPPVTPAPVAAQPITPVPIRIVEQTSTIQLARSEVSVPQAGGVTWHALSVDPWPTPRSQPTVVGAPLRPLPLTILALLAAVLGLWGCTATVGSYQFADGTTAKFALDDIRSNSFGVMLAVVIAALVGVGLLGGRLRIGVGLAGGASAALASLATMDVALVVAQLHEAQRAGLATGSVTITWEPAFYALVAAGVLALVALAVSFGAWREGGATVHPAVAILGALAVATMIVGTLIPTGGRPWSDNLSIPTFGALPSWLRLGALALVGGVGIIAFLSLKRWATGLAVGAVVALGAQWVGTINPPQPNTRGGPGIAITPLDGTALAVQAGALVAVVVLAVIGFAVATRQS